MPLATETKGDPRSPDDRKSHVESVPPPRGMMMILPDDRAPHDHGFLRLFVAGYSLFSPDHDPDRHHHYQPLGIPEDIEEWSLGLALDPMSQSRVWSFPVMTYADAFVLLVHYQMMRRRRKRRRVVMPVSILSLEKIRHS